jgi:hypothetical protein
LFETVGLVKQIALLVCGMGRLAIQMFTLTGVGVVPYPSPLSPLIMKDTC